MSRNLAALGSAVTLLAGTAMAEVPRVATDIAPVHSLVSQVMGDLGTPDLIVTPGASPHEYSLRPSNAAALESADLVFWVGETLTPWLADAATTLAGDADVTELIELEGVLRLETREDAVFEPHRHEDDDDHDHAGDHGHDHDDDHAGDHGHDHGDDHADDHGHDHGEDHASAESHGHEHGGVDSHAWLAPANAAVWLEAVAETLAGADPANAATYRSNAAEANERLAAVTEEIDAILAPVRGQSFIVFHDAYQYFETAFDIPAAGAISLSDASDPSPARVAEIQMRIADEGIVCVLSEPQFSPGLVATVMDGAEAQTAVLDPLGTDLEPGPDLYPQLLRNLATALASCV